MRVTVAEGFQVAHEGQVYMPGEVADVPDEVADDWARNGWVAKTAPKKAPAKKAAR